MATDFRLHPPDPDRDPIGADELAVRCDPKLIAAGWTRRSLAGPDRADEMIELYGSLGFEVKAVRLTPADFGPACRDCAPAICSAYVLIYTRRADRAASRASGAAGGTPVPDSNGEPHGSDPSSS